MKRTSFGGFAFSVLLIAAPLSTAGAADMPLKAAPMAPAYSWTGWYAGLNAGGDWGNSNTSTKVGDSAVPPFYGPVNQAFQNALGNPVRSLRSSGFTGGVMGGYNYQMGNWLVGAELDFESFRNAGSNSLTAPYIAPGTTESLASSVRTNWLFTARPRLGIVSNNWLFYGTGGLAVTQIKARWAFSETSSFGTENASVSSTKTGWVVGGGIETALPGKMFLGAEYLHVRFNGVSTSGFFATLPAGTVTNLYSHTAGYLSADIVRARIGMRF